MNQVVDTDQAEHIDPKEDIDLEHSIGQEVRNQAEVYLDTLDKSMEFTI